MGKIFIYSDVHISEYSSILRSRGIKYSTRLEYIIKSLQWAEEKIKELSTDFSDIVVNLGDTFDKSIATAEEITALKEIKWNDYNNLVHYVLVGNHESNTHSLEFNLANVLNSVDLYENNIVDKPMTLRGQHTDIHFLPYIIEADRKPLEEYFKFDKSKKNIILSHNDIASVQMGAFLSQDGFEVQDILDHCDLYLNGHLHNSTFIVPNRILNVGNLCGMNFSEDAFRYKHGLWEVDCDTLELTFYENPYALNFYKIIIDDKTPSLDCYELDDNCVLMIKCERQEKDNLIKELSSAKYLEKVVCYKIQYYDEELSVVVEEKEKISIEKIDHIQTFRDFIVDKLGNTQTIIDELGEICK